MFARFLECDHVHRVAASERDDERRAAYRVQFPAQERRTGEEMSNQEFVICSRIANPAGVLQDHVAQESKATTSATEAIVDLERRAEGFETIPNVEIKFVQVDGDATGFLARGFEVYADGRLRVRYWIQTREIEVERRRAGAR
jgi:hypothetical protein